MCFDTKAMFWKILLINNLFWVSGANVPPYQKLFSDANFMQKDYASLASIVALQKACVTIRHQKNA